MANKPPIEIRNETRDTVLASRCRVADSYFPRLIGLMGAQSLPPGDGLLILPCSSIHTHFMRFPIDVIYVSREDIVVALDENMAPWRFGTHPPRHRATSSSCRRAPSRRRGRRWATG